MSFLFLKLLVLLTNSSRAMTNQSACTYSIHCIIYTGLKKSITLKFGKDLSEIRTPAETYVINSKRVNQTDRNNAIKKDFKKG